MWLYWNQMWAGMSTTWKSWLCLYLFSNRGPNSQKSTQPGRKKKLTESCGISTLRAASCVELFSAAVRRPQQSSEHNFYNWGRDDFFQISVLNTASEHETARIYHHVFFVFFPCCGCVGIRAPQIQSHMMSVCTANYLEQKVFQDCYEPVLYLVSVFIPMISFTVRLSLWHSSYTVGKIFADSRGNK